MIKRKSWARINKNLLFLRFRSRLLTTKVSSNLFFFELHNAMNSCQVFDTELKSRQRQKAYSLNNDEYYDYLREESATRLVTTNTSLFTVKASLLIL